MSTSRNTAKQESALTDTAVEISVRSSVPSDAIYIQKLANHLTEEIFGPMNVLNVIEKALFSVTVLDSSEEVMAFAAFYDYPPPTAKESPANWVNNIAHELKVDGIHSLNTMFIHYFVTTSDYAVGCVQEIVKSLYGSVPHVDQILMCVPLSNHPDPAISDIFKPIKKTIRESSTQHATFYVSYRHEVSPVLHVRRAQMEDNDDLTPIFASQSNRLQEVYGDYFVAELIDSQDENHHALCAEKDAKAVAFMSLSSNVNLNLLNETFELKPFHGLRKPHPNDVLEPKERSSAKQKKSIGGDVAAQPVKESPEDSNVPGPLHTNVCLVTSNMTAAAQFCSFIHASYESNGSTMQETENGIQLSVVLEAFDKQIKLDLTVVPASTKHDVSKSDCLMFAYQPTDTDSVAFVLSEFEKLKVDLDNSSSADHVDSDTMRSGPQMHLFLQLVSPSDAEVHSDPVQQLAAESSVGVVQAGFCDQKSVQAALQIILEAICRNLFGIQTPSSCGGDDNNDLSERSSVATKAPVKLAEVKPSFVPEYFGDSNCFCIQLFCIRPEFETRSLDLMRSAFECYPDKDYCIITVPHLVPEFHLLQNFVRVPTRLQANLDQELYIFNRYGLLPDFSVRPSVSADLEQVERLIGTVENKDRILADLKQYNEARRDKDGTPLHAFSACVNGGEQVVGVAIVRQEENIEYLKSWFNIEDLIYYSHHQRSEHAHLHHFVINPTFHHLTKMFLQEIMRLDEKSCLYYPVFDPNVQGPEVEKHTLVTCLGEMVPVRPRRQISYPIHMLHGNIPSDRVLKTIERFALYSINRKLVLEPKVAINARVVVVGASDTSLSFLESLVFAPHLKFNNVTLVSPHGIPGELPVSDEAREFLSTSLSFNKERLSRMALRSWVTEVLGKLVSIDRKARKIHIRSSQHPDKHEVLSYDHLVVATGLQYQVPHPVGLYGNMEEDEVRKEFVQPSNVFTVNDEYDADYFLFYVKTVLAKSPDHLVVFGSTIDVYSCVRCLLNCGIKGFRIILARKPLADGEPTCFNNPKVEDEVDKTLRAAEVRILDKCELYSWQVAPESNHVTEVSLRVDGEWEAYSCDAIINFDEKRVDFDAFKALNDSCIVFDSRVVIDSEFHTNDICIRAAGPVTKFSRRYHADNWSHANFYSAEVGNELALSLLRLFDPTVEVDEAEEAERKSSLYNLVPLYHKPKVLYCILPANMFYLDVRKPDLKVPLEEARKQPNFGNEYETGAPDGDQGYFMIHVNAYRCVQSITCVSKSPIRCGNLVCLYGKNEKLLNRLVSRFDEGLIPDLFAYFEEPWAMALFHDRFEDLMQEIRQILMDSPPAPLGEDPESMTSFTQKVREIIEENMEMKPSELAKVMGDFQNSGYKQAIETRLLAYLSYNYYHLPMYAKPGMV